MDYPWYTIVQNTDKIEQGDVLRSWPVIIPEEWIGGTGDVNTDIDEKDMIIMSQSCDIQHDKIDNALVCPIWDIDKLGKYASAGDKNKRLIAVLCGLICRLQVRQSSLGNVMIAGVSSST